MKCKVHWKNNNNRDVLNQSGWINEDPSDYHVEGQAESHCDVIKHNARKLKRTYYAHFN